MTYQTIKLDVAGPVATITLNRPDKLNAFTEEMHRELAAALDTMGTPDTTVRALLLTGAGRGFCAGQDLGSRRGDALPDLGQTLNTTYNPLIRRLRKLPLPIVCAVNGVAAGAGASLARIRHQPDLGEGLQERGAGARLAFACDITLAARSAAFLQAFAKIGLVPDSGSTFFLPRLVGSARARALAMLADKIGAEQAMQWGMIWQVVDDDKLMAEATVLAQRLAAMPTRALAYIKRALDTAETSTLDRQLDLEAELQAMAGRTEDYREGVAAFHDKRTPTFKGR
jgi:2-(1,2-epoxy-1,2-dihydrophenyl)acetyl-CoA isomerase